MSSALLKLREQSRQFSTTEQEIAGHILENPQLVVDMSIHELAKHTFSSASSIVRLCNHTGFSGYKEFRKAVTYELAMREQTKRVEQKEIAHTDSMQDIIDILYTALANEDYEASLEQLSRTHIQKPGQTSGKAYKTSPQG